METTRRSPVVLLKWLVAIVVPALLFLIPIGDVFTAPIRLFFVVTLFMMIVIALELVPILMSAIFLPALYILLQIAPAETALSAWTKPLPFMLVGAFILPWGWRSVACSSGWPTASWPRPAAPIGASCWASWQPACCLPL